MVISNSIKNLAYVERIDEALNGQEALDMVMLNEVNFAKGKERLYDLIFLDLGMPIKDGYEACELIQKHYKLINKKCLLSSKAKNPLDNLTWLTDL